MRCQKNKKRSEFFDHSSTLKISYKIFDFRFGADGVFHLTDVLNGLACCICIYVPILIELT